MRRNVVAITLFVVCSSTILGDEPKPLTVATALDAELRHVVQGFFYAAKAYTCPQEST